MAVLFSIHATPHPRGMGKPCVKAIEPLAPVGVFDQLAKRFLQPDKAAVREALPAQWRKAFDRSGGNFWYVKGPNGTEIGETRFTKAPYLNLRDYRGRPLATIYALPYRFGA